VHRAERGGPIGGTDLDREIEYAFEAEETMSAGLAAGDVE
jgi:hypothetical protein